ncbi:family 20 glycosylhydrolase [candidate division KSB1 bacterium]|nr:family 20 glycosylhydrolase [candidate division KSB1 bacterium]
MNIIPRPLQATLNQEQFNFNPQVQIFVSDTSASSIWIARYFSDKIFTATGVQLKLIAAPPAATDTNLILLTTQQADSQLGAEGYQLEVKRHQITLRALKPAGLFYAVQTLLQLLPPALLGNQPTTFPEACSIPGMQIQDQPRYAWRGMHLDVCRHFFPVEFIKKYLDLLALHKMNVFHWHLTEDQGWRIEIKKYPRLTQIGSWRVDRTGEPWSVRAPQKPGEKATYGGFYTQDQIKEIVAYARQRFIMVVPEIEMPGHALAALAAYPQYSCTGGPFTVATGGYWPIMDVFCPGKEQTFEFLENILKEVIDLFPAPYLHIGADEVNKTRWRACPDCQARIKKEGLKDEAELQSYFVKRMEQFLISQHRKLIGWDEILEGGLAPEATVMSWRGIQGGIAAAQQNHDVIMSPTTHCYFDYYQARPELEPPAIGGYLPLDTVYAFEPTPAELTTEQAQHILGVQANIWTEYIPTSTHAEYMALPRMCALAEVAWTSKDQRDAADFKLRLLQHYLRLDALNVNYRQPDILGFEPSGIFIDQIQVKLEKVRPYSVIHYTLDGSEPDLNSPIYTQPFNLTETTELRIAEALPGGRMSPVKIGRFSKQTPRPGVTLVEPKAGVQYQYYLLTGRIDSVLQLTTLTPQQTGTQALLTFPEIDLPEFFGLEFKTYLQIEQAGIYTFYLESDDGSRLFIHDQLVVNNDGIHGAEVIRGQIALDAGYHPMRLLYFQAGGDLCLQVDFEGPQIGKATISEPFLKYVAP